MHPQRRRRFRIDIDAGGSCGRLRWCVPGGADLFDCREDRDEMRKAADRKDLVYDGIKADDRQTAVFRLNPRRDHQRPQAGARYVFDA
jgi:hypothetical protein